MDQTLDNSILVIGVGNAYRRDDGAGRYAARRIAEWALPGVKVHEASGEGAALMEAWAGHSRVFVIDATSSGRAPGKLSRLDARRGPVPAEFFHYSTHAFSLAEAVELARALDLLPVQLVIYGIEGQSYAAGEGLTEPVERAVEQIVGLIREEIADGECDRLDGVAHRFSEGGAESCAGPALATRGEFASSTAKSVSQ